jgi:hypothetical protein
MCATQKYINILIMIEIYVMLIALKNSNIKKFAKPPFFLKNKQKTHSFWSREELSITIKRDN